MTEEEVAVQLNGHEHEIKSLKHRMDDQEAQSKVIQDLAMSVKELALNMKNMMQEQKKQGERLDKLENEPAESMKSIRRTAVSSIIATIAGAAVTAAIIAIAQYI